MTRLLAIILALTLPLGVAAQPVAVPVTLTGTIAVPADKRIESLEKRSATLEKRVASLAKKRVTVAEITESTLEELP